MRYPILENTVITTMFLGVGLAALLTVVCLSDFGRRSVRAGWYHKVNYLVLQLTGWYFLISSGLIYYTHIGLIVGTMK